MWPFSKKAKNGKPGKHNLGDILLHYSVEPEEIERGLEQQGETGEPLGEILVSRGVITRRILQEALAEQKLARGEASRREISEFRRMTRSRMHEEATKTLKEAETESITMTQRLVV